MGLFTRKQVPPVAGAILTPPRKKSALFRVELRWRGLFGVVIVCFCLFFWMFMLGVWAGQTILFPQRVTVAKATPASVQSQTAAPITNEKH